MQRPSNKIYVETWLSKDLSDGKERGYKVNVCLGKPIDIISLKSNIIKDFENQSLQIKHDRTGLFKLYEKNTVEKCPICNSSTVNSEFRLNIFGGRYHQCVKCSHCFVINRPGSAVIEEFYSGETDYGGAYTDRETIETRVNQVVIPKVEWIVKQYETQYGCKPRTVLDVGAGAGHFVFACQQLGLDAYGIEVSKSGIQFCKTNFDMELKALDFLEDWNLFPDVDIVTFWGVIEHSPNPMGFLNAAFKLLSGRNSLVVVEVPRWDSLSTAIQSVLSSSVVRHLDPMPHINCFTDSSLCTAMEISGFAPVAAWYFGMDIYELITQISHFLKDGRIIELFGKHITSLQSAIDQGWLTDEIVVVGKPM